MNINLFKYFMVYKKKEWKTNYIIALFIFIRRERAARERLKEKRVHSMTKQARQAPPIDSL